MNIPSCLISVFKEKKGFVILDKRVLNRYRSQRAKYEGFRRIIDLLGEQSSSIQGLRMVITSFEKLLVTGNKVYLYADLKVGKCVGLLKVGEKKLFVRDMMGEFNEINPRCVLDFFVHESMRRRGIGHKLFEYMLKYEEIAPSKFGYDRPSHMLKSFLRKHYNLSKYIPQSNNFVIFNEFFDKDEKKTTYNQVSNEYKTSSSSPITQRELEPEKYKFSRRLDFRKYY